MCRGLVRMPQAVFVRQRAGSTTFPTSLGFFPAYTATAPSKMRLDIG
jgi:hypothetical protein